MNKSFTGRHFAMIMVAFFGVVIAVNLIMARYASSTFGGVVVDNSYVASQRFNTWLDKAKAQDALGWTARIDRDAGARVVLEFGGAPVDLAVTAVARHPLGRMEDVALAFDRQSDGRFRSREVLPAGRWRVRVSAEAEAGRWRQDLDLR